jgi:hypothetical protein
VIIADATKAEVLEMAGLKRAAALVALTDADSTNLHIALLARTQRADLAIVMRAESPSCRLRQRAQATRSRCHRSPSPPTSSPATPHRRARTGRPGVTLLDGLAYCATSGRRHSGPVTTR